MNNWENCEYTMYVCTKNWRLRALEVSCTQHYGSGIFSAAAVAKPRVR